VTLIIDGPSEVEEKFRQMAARRGLTPIELARALVEREALASADARETGATVLMPAPVLIPEEKAAAFLEWASRHRTDIPVVPMEAMLRDNLYEDRGL
jgi:tryptophan synthase alpha subunit